MRVSWQSPDPRQRLPYPYQENEGGALVAVSIDPQEAWPVYAEPTGAQTTDPGWRPCLPGTVLGGYSPTRSPCSPPQANGPYSQEDVNGSLVAVYTDPQEPYTVLLQSRPWTPIAFSDDPFNGSLVSFPLEYQDLPPTLVQSAPWYPANFPYDEYNQPLVYFVADDSQNDPGELTLRQSVYLCSSYAADDETAGGLAAAVSLDTWEPPPTLQQSLPWNAANFPEEAVNGSLAYTLLDADEPAPCPTQALARPSTVFYDEHQQPQTQAAAVDEDALYSPTPSRLYAPKHFALSESASSPPPALDSEDYSQPPRTVALWSNVYASDEQERAPAPAPALEDDAYQATAAAPVWVSAVWLGSDAANFVYPVEEDAYQTPYTVAAKYAPSGSYWADEEAASSAQAVVDEVYSRTQARMRAAQPTQILVSESGSSPAAVVEQEDWQPPSLQAQAHRRQGAAAYDELGGALIVLGLDVEAAWAGATQKRWVGQATVQAQADVGRGVLAPSETDTDVWSLTRVQDAPWSAEWWLDDETAIIVVPTPLPAAGIKDVYSPVAGVRGVRSGAVQMTDVYSPKANTSGQVGG
jgi:hypothetical protein